MVDAGKDKNNYEYERKKIAAKTSKLPKINIKALIIGAIVFLFFPVVAYQKQLDILTVFAAAGPLYIGYASETKLKGGILGFVAAIPLLYATFAGALGPITQFTTIAAFNTMLIIICASILGLGTLFGVLGAYLYQSRSKAKEDYEAKKPKGTKNRPIKEDKKDKKYKKEEIKKEKDIKDRFKLKKFEDTGDVGQNIVNLFRPKK